jgi:hypothetical protein
MSPDIFVDTSYDRDFYRTDKEGCENDNSVCGGGEK